MYPSLAKIRLKYPQLPNCPLNKEVITAVLKLKPLIEPGASVCIAVGSRGIKNIDFIVKKTVDLVKYWGGLPFIIPAMGSHGGATPEGQKKILAYYGITEESMGVPINATLEVKLIGYIGDIPIYINKNALGSDAVILINRIKPHTDFTGSIESGLLKMAAVGLGNDIGAVEIHKHGLEFLPHIIKSAGTFIINYFRRIGGIAILENYYGDTYKVVGLKKEEIEEQEKVLLIEAKQLTPCLPFDHADILLIDYIGKDISGTGLDPKLVGRSLYAKGRQKPVIRILGVLDLTPATEGNAIGIGIADLTTKKAVNKINFKTTYLNCLTSQGFRVGKIPITLDSDKELLDVAIKCSLNFNPLDIKLARIKNTLEIKEMYVSKALLIEMQNTNIYDYELIEKDVKISFDSYGNLFAF